MNEKYHKKRIFIYNFKNRNFNKTFFENTVELCKKHIFLKKKEKTPNFPDIVKISKLT